MGMPILRFIIWRTFAIYVYLNRLYLNELHNAFFFSLTVNMFVEKPSNSGNSGKIQLYPPPPSYKKK